MKIVLLLTVPVAGMFAVNHPAAVAATDCTFTCASGKARTVYGRDESEHIIPLIGAPQYAFEEISYRI